jgi:hypothetical protein
MIYSERNVIGLVFKAVVFIEEALSQKNAVFLYLVAQSKQITMHGTSVLLRIFVKSGLFF